MSKLTKQGYFIKKNKVDDNILNKIRKDLTVSPNTYFTGIVKKEKVIFDVYSEDDKYIKVPKFYGLKNLGKPKKNKEKVGKSINIKFKGKLRDYQQDIVKKSINYMGEKDGGLISLGCGQGKCLAYGTKVVMHDGTTSEVQYIYPGDRLMGDDGTTRTVSSITTGMEMMYLVSQENGENYTVNESHILSLIDSTGNKLDIEIKDYLKFSLVERNKYYGYKSIINTGSDLFTNNQILNYINNLNLVDTKLFLSSFQSRKLFVDKLITKYGTFIQINLSIKTMQILKSIIRSIGYTCYYDNGLVISSVFKTISKISVKSLQCGTYYGFTIDGNKRFLLEDFTVTHNTVIALYLACHFKVKTLVIVHKTFLLNQWLERIKQFTNASVGIIQQKKVETDNMIVVGMLQSIAKGKYSSKIFKDFGLVIFDEAHHAPSQYFSRALPLISCKKTLALSATPKRNDGLEKVLHWYFGDIIYQSDRINNKDVIVSLIDYTVKHKNFREFKLPFNGKVNKPKTINKIIKIDKRNDLILEILNTLYSNKLRQILVLSDRIEHLKIFESMINTYYPDYSYGYYIGGMKQDKLNDSAKQRIILASFGMASEALDIPSLNTLIMATPRSDVEQSVGRIIRKKNNKVKPLIVDIVDNLPSFVNQSKKRLRLYKKKDYYIEKKIYQDNELVETINITNKKIDTVEKFNPDEIDFV
tara:strand:+ start:1182 stop:3278 length:2097 start_codon:yes stop_codon:yes gene_type:complete